MNMLSMDIAVPGGRGGRVLRGNVLVMKSI